MSLALPIGISFHIFQLIAYLVDVARGNLKARRDIIVFACFVVYFPQVAAGPIERGHQILPQFERSRRVSIDDIARALWLIISGTFMKVAVADPLAPIAAFGFDSGTSNAASLLVAILAFTVQIYADFCGYSLMAKGISGLFGIELVWNFERPYFSTSIREFWHRWHISLSQWLRDYLYIPLGGNRISPARTEINLLTTMALGGLWHGAAWTFVAWGLLHGGALAVSRRIEDNRIVAAMPAWFGWALTMLVVIAGWALFRMHSFQTIAALREFSWDTGHWRMLGLIAGLATPVFLLESFQEVTPRQLCAAAAGAAPDRPGLRGPDRRDRSALSGVPVSFHLFSVLIPMFAPRSWLIMCVVPLLTARCCCWPESFGASGTLFSATGSMKRCCRDRWTGLPKVSTLRCC